MEVWCIQTNVGRLSDWPCKCQFAACPCDWVIESGRHTSRDGVPVETLLLLKQSVLTDACVCADDQHRKVRAVAGKAKDGGFQVLVVTRQIHERDHFGGTLTNLLCSPRLAVIHDLIKE